MAVGIADGFAKGFGLVNEIYDRKADEQYRANVIAERKAEREQDLQFRRDTLAENTRRFNEGQEREDKKYQDQVARQNILDQSTLARDRAAEDSYASTAELRSEQAAASREERLQAKLDRELIQKQRRQRDENVAATLATQKILSGMEDGSLSQDQYNELVEAANKGLLPLHLAFDPEVELTAGQIQEELGKMAAGEDVDKKPFITAMNQLLGSNNRYRTGTTITQETYPNAPPEAAGGRILSTEVKDISLGEGGIKPTVLVTYEGKDGKRHMYTAPMTESRGGGTPPVEVSFDDLASSYGGFLTAARHINSNYDALRAFARASNPSFQNPDGSFASDKFMDQRGKEEDRFMEMLSDPELAKQTAVGGLSFQQVADNPDLYNRYIESRVMGRTPSAPSARAYDRMIADILSSREFQRVNRNYKRNTGNDLTMRQAERMARFLDMNEKTGELERTKNREALREYKEWERSLLKVEGVNNSEGMGADASRGISQTYTWGV